LAGDVAMKHTKAKRTSEGFDVTLVTACVSGLSSCSRIDIMKNYSLQGYVSYVGTSALEISLEIIQDPLTEEEKSMSTIYFTMVALDPVTNKAIPAGKLLLETERDKELYDMGKTRSHLKKLKSKESLSIRGPKDNETQLIHQLYLDSINLREQMNEFQRKRQALLNVNGDHATAVSPVIPIEAPDKNMKWVKDTIHRNMLLMHSQNMNVNGKIFGGYIMRKSFEAAHLSATLFYGTHDIKFSYVDDIQFVRPVLVGSVIEFVTHVAYSRRGHCVTHCNCYEYDVVTNVRTLTNVLHYVFKVSDADTLTDSDDNDEVQPQKKFVEVIPREYKEILAYLEGKRTLDNVLGIPC
jgi:acyl-coenzyme A thioesterase 9